MREPSRPQALWRIAPAWARRVELSALVALALAAAGLLAFVGLADEVMENETRGFDRAVLLALREAADANDPLGPRWFEDTMRDVTGLGGIAILSLVSLASVGFLAMSRQYGAALLVAASVGGGMALSTLLKELFGRSRPDLVEPLAQVYTASFPSGHAMLSAVTYLTLGALLARVQPKRRLKAYVLGVAVTATLLVGASRVYLGVHWPTDVLAGWSIGAAWAILCWLLAVWLQRRGAVETAPTAESAAQPGGAGP